MEEGGGGGMWWCGVFFFFQAEDGIRDYDVTGVQTCALPIYVFCSDVLIVFLSCSYMYAVLFSVALEIQ